MRCGVLPEEGLSQDPRLLFADNQSFAQNMKKPVAVRPASHAERVLDHVVPLEQAWCSFETLITRSYLDVLNQAEPIEASASLTDALQMVQMHKVVRIVYDRKESNLAKLNSMFSALALSRCSVFVLVCSDGKIVSLYLGVRGDSEDAAADAREVLASSLRGNFPGAKSEPIETSSADDSSANVASVSDGLRDNECMAIVTGVPSLKKDTEDSFSQGLEKVIDAMGDKPYAALFLATPVELVQLADIERGYQTLSSDLSAFNVGQVSLSKQESISIGKSISEGLSLSLSKSVSIAESSSVANMEGKGDSTSRNYGAAVAAAGSIIGGAIGSVVPGAGTLVGAAIGGAVGGVVGSMIGSKTTSENTSITKTTTETETSTEGKTETQTKTETVTETVTESKGSTIQFNLQDRKVVDALSIVDEQLKRIREAKSYGSWNWGAYFLGPNIETVEAGAQVYSGVLRGEQTGVEHCAISYWVRSESEQKFDKIMSSISQFRHPRFDIGRDGNSVVISPTALINTTELAVGMALPQKSIPGVPVFDSIEFGRSVSTHDRAKAGSRRVKIGNVYHLGEADSNQDVELDVDSLCSHMFVTGSTGAGKSNFVYSLVHNLREQGVGFLVVEPAKGEYKEVFGDVPVFGTNPYKTTELLRINPFSFPKDIHVMEHIDRLIEILNAAWPMYAAMPAILKDAVEVAYKRQGWDLVKSECRGSRDELYFPDFHDLLDVLPEVIEASKYDSEVKNNYTGALVTRVKALTNGYYRMIFQKDELPPGRLLDKSCIVDISRVGSTETKSLLMGMIFLKLQEYRMSNASEPNSRLKHITVLEEAHNLLRKTSTEQGMESANLAGKSVEMLTNAIAEMRTFGEGFVIADQAPGLLDPAVIRNTNTKVVFRLPDMDDRALVGKAENLDGDQIGELARLELGCAAVYQNNWLEAVLCQTQEFEQSKCKRYKYKFDSMNFSDGRALAERTLLQILIGRLTRSIEFSKLPDVLPEREARMLKAYFPDAKLAKPIPMNERDLVDHLYLSYVRNPLRELPAIKDRAAWTQNLIRLVFSSDVMQTIESAEKDVILQTLFKVLARYDTHAEQREGWNAEVENLAKWRTW